MPGNVLRHERDLFSLGKEIIRHPIQHQPSDRYWLDDFFRNQLRRVEHIEIETVREVLIEELHAQFPFRKVASLYRSPQIAPVKVRIRTVDFHRLVPDNRLEAEFRFPDEFDESRLVLVVQETERMNTKPSIKRKERGMARSDMTHMIMCMDSGVRLMKSQKLSWADWACGKARSGSSLTAWTISGNRMASWMKKTGMLLPTISQLPSLVYILTAKPRTSRARSNEPFEPATVEKRTKTGVFSPTRWKMSARVYSLSDFVVSK